MSEKDKPDVILIMCPTWGVRMPPLNLAYLSTYLRSKGLKTGVMDFNVWLYNKLAEEDRKIWETENMWNAMNPDYVKKIMKRFEPLLEEYVNKVLETGVKIIGFSVHAANCDFTMEFARRLKSRDSEIKTVFGGVQIGSRVVRYEMPEDCCDFMVVGEGEESLYELVTALKKGGKADGIPGLVPNKNSFYGKPEYKQRPTLDIDSIPYPDFEEFDLSEYTTKALPILGSRGCIGRCTYCMDYVNAGAYRARNPENVFEEMKFLNEKYGTVTFHFNDLLVNGDMGKLEKLCDLLIGENMGVGWTSYATIRKEMTPEILGKIRKSGCPFIQYGFESGSNDVLRAMNKFYTAEEAETVLRHTKEAGIDTSINLITGFPGETEESHSETMDFLRRNKDCIGQVANVSTCFIMKETVLHRNAEKYGIDLTGNWICWKDSSGNNRELRNRRANELLNLLEELNIPVIVKNMNDGPVEEPDVLLVNCPPWGVDNPPVGIGYLSSYLEGRGLKARVLDFNIYLYNRTPPDYRMLWHVENKNYWSKDYSFKLLRQLFGDSIEYCSNQIAKSGANIVGFSVVDPKERMTIEVIKRVKELNPKKKIILGGPATSAEESRKIFIDSIPDLIDGFVVGEGEETLLEIVKAVKSGEPIENIPGVLVYRDGKYLDYAPRPLIRNLDTIPFPKYDGFNMLDYSGGTTLLLEWSRGCIGNCSFCKGKALLGGYRSRSPEHILEELEYHVKESNVREFTICDSLINGDLKNLEAVCDSIIGSGLNIKWNCQAIPLKGMRPKLLKKMKMAGCYEIQLGVESGSDKVLKKMRKIFSAKDAESVVRMAHDAGLHTALFIIVGFPGENEKEFEKTIDFVKRNADYIDTIKSINSMHVIYGTEIHKNPDKYGIVLPKDDWHYRWHSKDGDNDSAVRNTRIKRLMEILHRLNIELRETNLTEGKESELLEGDSPVIETLRKGINKLQDLNMKSKSAQMNPEGDTVKNDKLDVALLLCPPWGVDMPPLGLAYVSSNLRRDGFSTEVIDFNIELYNRVNEEDKKMWDIPYFLKWSQEGFHRELMARYPEAVQDLIDRITDKKPLLVGFSANASNFLFTAAIAQRLKEKDCNLKICMGGPQADFIETVWRNEKSGNAEYSDILKPVDFLVVGEGEITLSEVLGKLRRGEDPKGTPGVLSADGREKFIPRPPIHDIDGLAYPTFSESELKNYKFLNKYEAYVLPILGSRGCMGRCRFCNDWKQRNGYKSRSAENILDEIKTHLKNYDLHSFSFLDLAMNGNLTGLEKLCDLIIGEGLDIKWWGQGTLRRDMGSALLRKMKRAGCTSIVFGAESFSDNVLKLMGKSHTREDAEIVLRRMHDAGLDAYINLIVGFPGESDEDFQETLDFIVENHGLIKGVSSINPCTLTYGSDIHLNSEKLGISIPEESYFYRWSMGDENTYEIRKERIKKMVEVFERTGTAPNLVNLYDEPRETLKVKVLSPAEERPTFSAGKSPLRLFFECLQQHGPSYTLKRTAMYIKNEI